MSFTLCVSVSFPKCVDTSWLGFSGLFICFCRLIEPEQSAADRTLTSRSSRAGIVVIEWAARAGGV